MSGRGESSGAMAAGRISVSRRSTDRPVKNWDYLSGAKLPERDELPECSFGTDRVPSLVGHVDGLSVRPW